MRATCGLVVLIEAIAFFVGAGLHLGISLPVPFIETHHLSSAVLEAGSGVFLLIAAAAVLAHRPRAWKIAVAAHVTGVASIAFGIAKHGGGSAAQSSHHPAMLLVLIVVLIGLSTPPCRHALETGRRHSRPRRRRILQAL
ncbi:MAG TPA: hypothetical protein VEY33_04280 [Gemmatimonadota bacterium]|nr:hypothetical protein [Gemmatimonadota bacterium]